MSAVVACLDSLTYFYVALSTISALAIIADGHHFQLITSYNAYIKIFAKRKEAFFV